LSSLSLSARRPRGRRDPSSKILPMGGSHKGCVSLALFCLHPRSLALHASAPPVRAEQPRGARRSESCRAKRRKPEGKRRNPHLWGPRRDGEPHTSEIRPSPRPGAPSTRASACSGSGIRVLRSVPRLPRHVLVNHSYGLVELVRQYDVLIEYSICTGTGNGMYPQI
jgi:hypothetical protein